VYRESVASRSLPVVITQTGMPRCPRLPAIDNPRIPPPMTSAPRLFAPLGAFAAIAWF